MNGDEAGGGEIRIADIAVIADIARDQKSKTQGIYRKGREGRKVR